MNLENRAAIVTGGAQGIGKAVCLRTAREGAHVLVADNQPQKARQVSDEIASMGNRSSSMEVDVSVKQNVEEMVAKTSEIFGKIDILVNAAGIFISTPIEDIKEEDWDRVIAINLNGTFLCSQIADFPDRTPSS